MTWAHVTHNKEIDRIMAIVAKAGGKDGGGESFPLHPAGVHAAICIDVVDLGILEVTYAGETKSQHKVRVVWQTAEGRAGRRYTLSLHEKATLRKDLESWRSRAFTPEEEAGFDVETVIGVPCMINVTHRQAGAKTYANVVGVMPLPKGMDAPPMPEDYVRVAERTPEHAGTGPHDEEPPALTDDDIPF